MYSNHRIDTLAKVLQTWICTRWSSRIFFLVFTPPAGKCCSETWQGRRQVVHLIPGNSIWNCKKTLARAGAQLGAALRIQLCWWAGAGVPFLLLSSAVPAVTRLPGLKDLLNTDLFLSLFRLHHPDSHSSPSVVTERDYIWLICMKNVIIPYPCTCAIRIIFNLQLFHLSNNYSKELTACIFYDLE